MAKKMRPEEKFKKNCLEKIRKLGILAVIMEKNSHSGIPDVACFGKNGRFLLLEFKRPDGKGIASEEQLFWIEYFSKSGPRGTPAAVLIESEDELFHHIKVVFGI